MDAKVKKAMKEIQQAKQKRVKKRQYDQETLKTNHVTFLHAFKMFWRQGRIMNQSTSRHNYWYMLIWQLLIKGAIFLVGSMIGVMGMISSLDSQDNGKQSLIMIGIMTVLYIILFGYVLVTYIPSMTMTIRRYKDLGFKRWYGIVVYIILAILMILNFVLKSTGSMITINLFIIILIGNIIICSLPKGTFHHKI